MWTSIRVFTKANSSTLGVTSCDKQCDYLSKSLSLPGTDQVLLGNGRLPIFSIGSAQFCSPHKAHTTLTLKNLLLVQVITKNLISISKFAKDNNVLFEFHSDKCLIKSQASFEVVLQSTVNKDGLYSFGSLPATPTSSASINTLTGQFLPNKALP